MHFVNFEEFEAIFHPLQFVILGLSLRGRGCVELTMVKNYGKKNIIKLGYFSKNFVHHFLFTRVHFQMFINLCGTILQHIYVLLVPLASETYLSTRFHSPSLESVKILHESLISKKEKIFPHVNSVMLGQGLNLLAKLKELHCVLWVLRSIFLEGLFYN